MATNAQVGRPSCGTWPPEGKVGVSVPNVGFEVEGELVNAVVSVDESDVVLGSETSVEWDDDGG